MRDRDKPSLPVGKLPPEMLARLLAAAPVADPRVLVGPGVGLDCAVIDLGAQLLVCKSDPVTFATDRLGAYLVQVNANDLATTGATPSWLLVTLLLPENAADEAMAERLMAQIGEVTEGPSRVLQWTGSGWEPYPLPERDGLARAFKSAPDTKGRTQWPTPPTGERDRRESNPTDRDVPDGDG